LSNGAVDSTETLEPLLFVEETFGTAVDDEDILLGHFGSIERVTRYVVAKLAEPVVWGPRPSNQPGEPEQWLPRLVRGMEGL
jgi:hypothetical protein